MTFGDKVKSLRTEKGWIQQELADELGVSVRTIKNYESGDSYPKNRLIYKKLAEIFSIDVSDLLVENELFDLPEKGDDAYDDYNVLKHSLSGLKQVFRSDKIKQEDKDIFIRKIWDLYWDGKEK
ncbi:MAG: helix-turn-helix transcriptional regulator [Peptoniphilus sp.]|nr:helix-turn-helix transcriptional regulator [Peptoniphilus sp.]MDD7362709.1 helix-turn-helix transcriptional regulator [Bacillota bacterium]MDY6044597.1 helix-turn-helix transcriptional regulator [Peptoniphilus sp.]